MDLVVSAGPLDSIHLDEDRHRGKFTFQFQRSILAPIRAFRTVPANAGISAELKEAVVCRVTLCCRSLPEPGDQSNRLFTPPPASRQLLGPVRAARYSRRAGCVVDRFL